MNDDKRRHMTENLAAAIVNDATPTQLREFARRTINLRLWGLSDQELSTEYNVHGLKT